MGLLDGRPNGVIVFDIDEGSVTSLYVVLNPNRLAHIAVG